jgi:hypothetical protein
MQLTKCKMVIARIGKVDVVSDVGVDVSCRSRCSTFRSGPKISGRALQDGKLGAPPTAKQPPIPPQQRIAS